MSLWCLPPPHRSRSGGPRWAAPRLRGSNPQCLPTVKRTQPGGRPESYVNPKSRCSTPHVRRAGGQTPRSVRADRRSPWCARSRFRVARGRRSVLDLACTTRSRLPVRLRGRSAWSRPNTCRRRPHGQSQRSRLFPPSVSRANCCLTREPSAAPIRVPSSCRPLSGWLWPRHTALSPTGAALDSSSRAPRGRGSRITTPASRSRRAWGERLLGCPVPGLRFGARSGQYLSRTGGNNAPMSQNSGRKMPRTNMTQWPLLMVMTPRVIARMRYRMPKPPPIQYATTATFRWSSPLNSTVIRCPPAPFSRRKSLSDSFRMNPRPRSRIA